MSQESILLSPYNSTPSYPMSDLSNATVEELIERFEKDILFDVHSIERRVNFSDAKKELQRRGKSILTEIGNHLMKRFPKGDFFGEGSEQEDFFLAWGYLLSGIIRDHNLDRSSLPYTSKTPFGEQNMHVWANFFLTQATS